MDRSTSSQDGQIGVDSAPLLTRRDVARLAAVDTQTVIRWERRGELAAVRIGGNVVRYTPAAVERLLAGKAAGAVGSTSNAAAENGDVAKTREAARGHARG